VRILLATDALDALGGSETYVVTIAGDLQRLGHDVQLYARTLGAAADQAAELGLRATSDPRALPADVDAIVVQDGAVACDLAISHPLVPQLFVAHSDLFDLQLPLEVPGLVQVVVTLYDRVDERIRALASEYEIVRLSQPVDVTRFVPLRPLPPRARTALALGNYVRGPRADLLERACERAGVELRRRGGHAPDGVVHAPELAYNEADIVFGKARVVIEAMACGRAVYVYDHNGADGWVTAERYERLAADNFGGQRGPAVTDVDALVADLIDYDPQLGLTSRDLAVAHHASSRHAADLAQVLKRLVPRPAAVDAPLFELARLVRSAHRADSRQFLLQAEVERLGGLVQAQHDETDRLHAAVRDAEDARAAAAQGRDEAQAAADAAERRARAAEDRAGRADAAYAAVATTRRWQMLQRAMRPLDRLRARRTPHEDPSGAAPDHRPVPFVVGVPRSGTTLLRLQLDAHPDLAVGPESGIGFVLEQLAGREASPEELVAAWAGMSTFPDYGWTRDELVALLGTVTPWSVADGVRAIFTAYAARHGKPRWGEKTPNHLKLAARISATLPEAHILHLIRDGRGVLLSLRGLHFAPGDGSIEAIAREWRDTILEVRAAHAQGLVPNYRELRYEHLLHDPEMVLRGVCAAVDLPFDPVVLRAHERARERFEELPEVRTDGPVTRTREERWGIHDMTAQPPDPAEDTRWRDELTGEEIARFEAVAGDLLDELGYARAATAVPG
jgi:hypothetical protein